jgi:branched-chain amino acid aminotransferase
VRSDPSKWGVTSLQLQRPEHIYSEGRVRPWEEATLHVSSEAVIRGLNVFEAVKGYWQPDGDFTLLLMRAHYERLRRSARLLHIPVDFEYDEFEAACFAIARAEVRRGKDLYIRATLFVVEGHYGEGQRADLVLTAYQQEQAPPEPIDMGTSTWRRAPDLSLPARVKSGSSYQLARLARLEGRSRGFDDMILLNPAGRVAESTGACVLMVRGGTIYSPPPWEGALESLTLDVLEALAAEAGVDFAKRPIERSELHVADELALTGTLTEVTFVRAIDELELPESMPVLEALSRRYRDAVRGVAPHAAATLTPVPDYVTG